MFPYRRLPGHITGLYLFAVANFLLLCHMTLVQGDITVLSVRTNQTVYDNIPDMPAYFGEPIPDAGILGQVVYANPANACSPIDSPPNSSSLPSDGLTALKWIVLIKRNDCSFSQKVLNAQRAGFDAAIVHNVNSDQLEPMGPSQGKVIDIPSVFIGETNGLTIRRLYTYDKGYLVMISSDFPLNLNEYLVTFTVGVGVFLLIVILVMIFKCFRDRRHRMRHRLPTRLLKKLPIRKFKKGDQYDVCAICLEDYKEDEKLRVLPCSHTYHTKCIDPWLTENRRNCPVCKRKVLLGVDRTTSRSSDTDNSDEDDDGDGSIAPTENTPLLTGSGSSTNRALNFNDQVDAVETEHHENVATLSVSSSSSSHGGIYQSFATPACSPSIYSVGTEAATIAAESIMLALPVVLVGRDLTTSSGEHSVNGEYVDFSPIDQHRVSQGPVEIAIDVAAKQTNEYGGGGPSSSSTSGGSSKPHVMVV